MYPGEDGLSGHEERSFGVRAACCRFPFHKLACESPNHRRNLDSSFPTDFQPASWLEAKAAASCTHSKASLRVGLGGVKQCLTASSRCYRVPRLPGQILAN